MRREVKTRRVGRGDALGIRLKLQTFFSLKAQAFCGDGLVPGTRLSERDEPCEGNRGKLTGSLPKEAAGDKPECAHRCIAATAPQAPLHRGPMSANCRTSVDANGDLESSQ